MSSLHWIGHAMWFEFGLVIGVLLATFLKGAHRDESTRSEKDS